MTGHRWAIAAGVVAAVAVLSAFFTLVSAHAFAPDSDGASVVLQARAVARGDVLLHGWRLSLDSFWLVDTPFYVVAYLLVGVRQILMHVVPAVIAALVVAVGVLMARDRRHGSAAVAGSLVVAAVLVLPTHTLAELFLVGPLHIATALWALLALWALRSGRMGWGWVAAVLLFAAGMNGDLMIVAYGIVPAFLAGIVAMARLRTWRGGAASVSAAVVGGVLGEAVRQIVKRLGAFAIAKANPIATPHQMLLNVRQLVVDGAGLLGLGSGPSGTGGVPLDLQWVHGVEAVVLAVGLILGSIRLVSGAITGGPSDCAAEASEVRGRSGGAPGLHGSSPDELPLSPTPRPRWYQSEPGSWRLDDMLTIACFGAPITFDLLAVQSNPAYTRYLTVAAVFLAILAGRVVARRWSTLTALPSKRLLTLAGVGVLCCFAAGVGYTLAAPAPVQTADTLASWLQARHLHSGVGAYWSASITTVVSADTVAVRPVIEDSEGRLVRYQRESTAAWYQGREFQFFVSEPVAPWGGDTLAAATATWGVPAQVTDVGIYQVAIWRHPFTVAPTSPPGTP